MEEALKEMQIDAIESRLLGCSVKEGCELLFSVKSDIGNEALKRLLVHELFFGEEFFDIVVAPTHISVVSKFNNMNWIYTDAIQITRFACGTGGNMLVDGYTFMDALRLGCKHLKKITFDYVSSRKDEAKLVTLFVERYMP